MLAQIITENGQKKIKPLTADAGAGNPVGTIIVVCSNQIPSNYLPLGTQYDTSLYPVLYALLGTDTTPTASALGLPTLSSGQYAIKATSGLSENAQDNVINTLNEQRSYSTEEHLTGKKWIDGKPIYRKSFSLTDSSFPYNTGLSNVNEIIKIEAIAKDSSNDYFNFPYANTSGGRSFYYNKLNGKIITEGNTVFSSVIITLEYTKTTD